MSVTINQLYGATQNDPSSTQNYGPLAALYNNKFAFDALQYPRDLGSSYKGHVVKFDIYEVNPITLQEISSFVSNQLKSAGLTSTQSVLDAADKGIGNALQAGGKLIGDTYAAGQELYKQIDQPNGLVNITDSIGTQFSKTLGKVAGGNYTSTSLQVAPRTTSSIKSSVSLYMPDSVNFSYNSDYTNLNLAEAAGSLPIVGKIAKAITSTAGPEGSALVRLGLNAAGYVFNPQQQLMFQGIDFRTYQMSFTFTPHSRQEAENIKNIIQTFRKHAAPSIVTGTAGFFFNPPAMFDVSFLHNGQKNPNLNYIKRSVIENIDVNYAPNGWASHEDGAPVQTTLTLSFKEMVLVDKTAIEQGY